MCICDCMCMHVSICSVTYVPQSPLCDNVFLIHCCVCQAHWPSILQGFSTFYSLSYHSIAENTYIGHGIWLLHSFSESKLKLYETLEIIVKKTDLCQSFLTILKKSLAKVSTNNKAPNITEMQ